MSYLLGCPTSLPFFLYQYPLVGKESACYAGDCLQYRRCSFNPWVEKILWIRKWQSTSGLWPQKSMDRGAWWAVVHRDHKNQTQLSNWTTTTALASGFSREKEPGGTIFIFLSSFPSHWFESIPIHLIGSMSVYPSTHLPIYTHEFMKAKLYRLLSASWTFRKAGDVSSEAGSVSSNPRMGEDGSLSSSSQEERENSSFFHLFVLFSPPESYMRFTHFGESNLLPSVYRFKC